MLRIADPKDVPLNAIIVCASCEKGVYMLVNSEGMRADDLRSIKMRGRKLDGVNTIWCSECLGHLGLNHRILYIPPIDVYAVMNDNITLGHRIMAFEHP